MELTRKDVFKITVEENNFDKLHFDHIKTYINVNENRIISFPTANMHRSNADNYHTREITLEEIKTYIRR